MGVCNCSMSCCTLLYVHSSFAIILTGKRELVAVLSLSCDCCVALPRYAMDLSAVCDCGISNLLNFESFQAWAEMLPAR